MLKKYIFNNYRIFCEASNRKLILPEQFSYEKIDDFFLVKTRTYEFIISKLPEKHFIYKHEIQTPALVLKKPGIHVFPKQIPEINKREKFKAVTRKIQQQYQKAFRNCKEPQEFFHMNRKIKTQIRNRLDLIGVVNDKYKHYMMFKPYQQLLKIKTKQEYIKKGVKIQCLGGIIIYPKGEVWMPTNQKYLIDFCEVLKKIEGNKNVKNILDLGCGSGILSFLAKKSFKNSKIVAVDSSKAAVDTTNINAAQYHFEDVTAFQFDLTKQTEFAEKLKQEKLPNQYDLILINPPWLHASKLPQESQLEAGVYDANGKMLSSSLKIASTHLRDKESKIFLIYSDLNKNLNLEQNSVEQICKNCSLLIHEIKQRPLIYNIEKSSPLNQFKQKSQIQLFQIRKA